MIDKIKYANCWEDADVLLTNVNLSENKSIISIASGGDNSLALLTTSPKKLIAVDVNKTQLYLCELKAVAISELKYEEMLQLIFGRNEAIDIFQTIVNQLTPSCKKYWLENEIIIKNGILNSGKFEKYFEFFRNNILPCIHSKEKIELLLCEKTEKEQIYFFEKEWNSLRWQFFFKIFFSKIILGNFGRTKSYQKHVEISVSDFILKQSSHHLKSKSCQGNYFLEFIFMGQFSSDLPFYLREENFELIKSNTSKLELKHGNVEEYLTNKNQFDFCNFSNIFEYMSKEKFKSFSNILIDNLPKNAQISYWNLMVDRVFSDDFSKEFSKNNITNEHEDKGFFYKRFVTDIKI